MKVLVFGGTGKIGSAAAFDLVRDESVDSVGITGRSKGSLERTARWIGSKKISAHVLDSADKESIKQIMARYDVGIITLPDRKSSYRTVEAAIDCGLNVVDVLEEYHRKPDPYEAEGIEIPPGLSLDDYGESLHRRAQENGVTLLDGMGFAPGLSNITLAEGIRKVSGNSGDDREIKRGKISAIARVGGIPTKNSAARHPLKYMITWSFGHVLREYMVKVKIIRDGKIVEVDPTSERERFRFQEFGQDEMLECAITPGMPSFIYTRPFLEEFAEKTIRWPGHWQGIDTLKECGLLDLEPVKFDDSEIEPRKFFLSLIEPRMRPQPGDEDACIMWNTAVSEMDGKKKDGEIVRSDCYMRAKADLVSGLSAMSRVTGFSAAIGARLLVSGRIKEKGIVPPENCISGELYSQFLNELDKRDITIKEVVKTEQ